MRLGIAGVPHHQSPGEWAAKLHALGCRAVVFPCDHRSGEAKIDAYVRACCDHDLVIAEVGAWSNPMHLDRAEQAKNVQYCQEQLRMAEYIGARCCVNIAGTEEKIWDGGYAKNYSAAIRQRIIATTQEIIDAVKPVRTCYTLEPMPWMVPDSPEDYLQMLREVDRSGFAVHLDVVNMISCPDRYFFNSRFIEKCFHLLGPDIKSCHVKDIRLERFLTFNLKETACGQGTLDIIRYAQLATATDPELPFIIEHLHSEEEYVAALQYVRQLTSR